MPYFLVNLCWLRYEVKFRYEVKNVFQNPRNQRRNYCSLKGTLLSLTTECALRLFPRFWSPCWVIAALYRGGDESAQVPGRPVGAASRDTSEQVLFVSHKTGSITKQVTESKTKKGKRQTNWSAWQCFMEGEHFTELKEARYGPSKNLEVWAGVTQFLKQVDPFKCWAARKKGFSLGRCCCCCC